jgi:hypothetical protein
MLKLRLHGIVELWTNSTRGKLATRPQSRAPVNVRLELDVPGWGWLGWLVDLWGRGDVAG